MDEIKTEKGSNNNKMKPKKRKKKDTSDESDIEEEAPLFQDQDDDIIDLVDPNIVEKTTLDICSICGDIGKDNELWYRCVMCSSWSHSECTGWDSAKDYICDFCKYTF
ncbi:uncharacterized protein LOC128984251 [Macrosteles quadrilineatus]|uniref:uncharacterized protein LOC128984251 n=1 Tax=Macrosteles quadrilineatus TaxID=74068 RepID=UPI0023E275A5|nr:uncharacterized protein LOC128984251 [Macrosteles quadrilineatus]